jgi:hypothetical protein
VDPVLCSFGQHASPPVRGPARCPQPSPVDSPCAVVLRQAPKTKGLPCERLACTCAIRSEIHARVHTHGGKQQVWRGNRSPESLPTLACHPLDSAAAHAQTPLRSPEPPLLKTVPFFDLNACRGAPRTAMYPSSDSVAQTVGVSCPSWDTHWKLRARCRLWSRNQLPQWSPLRDRAERLEKNCEG